MRVLEDIRPLDAMSCPISARADARRLRPRSWTTAPPTGRSALMAMVLRAHARYDSALLQYIYYHNWYVGNHPGIYCPNNNCAGIFLGATGYV